MQMYNRNYICILCLDITATICNSFFDQTIAHFSTFCLCACVCALISAPVLSKFPVPQVPLDFVR